MLQKKASLLVLILPLLLFQSISSHPQEEVLPRDKGCTTALAAGNATSDGTIILAKNRDLSEYEIQWLYHARARAQLLDNPRFGQIFLGIETV